jgi:hypothetical protein
VDGGGGDRGGCGGSAESRGDGSDVGTRGRDGTGRAEARIGRRTVGKTPWRSRGGGGLQGGGRMAAALNQGGGQFFYDARGGEG